MRPVPFEPGRGWAGFVKRCISLLGGGSLEKRQGDRAKAKEREKEKARRARQIYFAGVRGLQQPNDNLDNGSESGAGDASFGRESGGMKREEESSLAFFAVICAVLAVGSHSSSSSRSSNPAENPAFFFALSQQALGVWDMHTPSSESAEGRERMDFLLASLIGVVYLMISGSSASAAGENEDKEGVNLIYPLVCYFFKLLCKRF